MNPPLQKAGLVLVVLFGLLFAQLNWITVVKADEYRNDTRNNSVRILQQDYERQRGSIIVDGVPVALSTETMDTFRYQRSYPDSGLFAHVVGYRPVYGEMTGIEALENQFLNGTADAFATDRLLEMFTGRRANGGDVILSLRREVQEAAYEGLINNPTASQVGAVVAIDPTTGAILAMVSTPSFDPNRLVVHDFDDAQTAYEEYDTSLADPLLNRATSRTFPPGSTFKVIVAAAALQNGLTPDSLLAGGAEYDPGVGDPIHNSGNFDCGATLTLQDALRISCNTAFSRYGVEQLGAQSLQAVAQSFGFEDPAPVISGGPEHAVGVATSHTGEMANPDGSTDPGALAQSCIGQRDVRWSPLQAALVAATVANNGVQMRPYLVDSILDANREVQWRASPSEHLRPVSSAVSGQLRQMMNSVVSNGTGTNAQIDGFEVGGKTGTAQNDDAPEHGWFIGYARTSGGEPVVAVAVLIQNAGSGGSGQAARIARQVMSAAIAVQGVD